jgi:hypothetical protein
MEEINKYLRPILLDGEFYKKENRTEFTESYNDIIKLEEDIKNFEMDIAPNGELGKRYALAKSDMSSLPIRRRKIQLITEEAKTITNKIIEQARKAMVAMTRILEGILKKDTTGKYDTLVNVSAILKTPASIDGLADAIKQFQKALQILNDIDAMEEGR